MAIVGLYESSLANSEVFQGLDNSIKLKNKAINLIKTAKKLSVDDIEVAYISIKSMTDGLVKSAIKQFEVGNIVLMYNDTPSLSITQALPFITLRTGDVYKTYVFMDKYITKSRDGTLNLQAVVLRDLLQSALISNILKSKYQELASNQYMQKTLTRLYAKFVIRVINREYAISADKILSDVIEYWVNRFFLDKVLGANDLPQNLEILATAHIKFIDEMKLKEIRTQYDSANPSNISDLLDLIKTASPRLRTLALNIFMGKWIDYYYIPSLLAIDNIEYLIFMILALLSGNNIISIAASEIVRNDKSIKAFKEELLKIS